MFKQGHKGHPLIRRPPGKFIFDAHDLVVETIILCNVAAPLGVELLQPARGKSLHQLGNG